MCYFIFLQSITDLYYMLSLFNKIMLFSVVFYIHISCLHIHTHLFNGPFSGTTQVSRYQKGKTNLDFTEARDSEWQWHQLGYMQVCTLLHSCDQEKFQVLRDSVPVHTHTHTFNGPFSETTWVGRYQKGKTNLDFTGARDSEWQWHQLDHMQVCTRLVGEPVP